MHECTAVLVHRECVPGVVCAWVDSITVIWLYFALKIFRMLLFRSFNFVRSPAYG